MQDEIKDFLDSSRALNSDVFTLTRIQLMVLLNYSFEGVQYRELKAALGISDGNLKANLNKLETLNYIEKNEIEMDNKKLSSYSLTSLGKKEVDKFFKWIKIVQSLGEPA
ncbi:MAG: transcriptional regulator [Promethearchaeota archaeon]